MEANETVHSNSRHIPDGRPEKKTLWHYELEGRWKRINHQAQKGNEAQTHKRRVIHDRMQRIRWKTLEDDAIGRCELLACTISVAQTTLMNGSRCS